jgi:cob(I)alamin adenosyltransferase
VPDLFDRAGAVAGTGSIRRVAKIYTGIGDDGTTGLLYGGRASKDSDVIDATGTVDEAQALMGAARAEAEPGSDLDGLLVDLERQLWVLMAELTTAPENRRKLRPGKNLVTAEMVAALEAHIDEMTERTGPITDFVVPGENRVAALLDVARAVVRRAERRVVTLGIDPASQVGPYLNRLSDLLWATARWQEGTHRVMTRPARQRRSTG